MRTPRQALLQIYILHVSNGQKRIPIVERFLGISRLPDASEDLRRNEADIYRSLCADDDDGSLTDLLQQLMSDMRNVSYGACQDVIAGFDFLQMVVATALWKHHLRVDKTLEMFARDFDRLDVASERRRLYEFAQQRDLWR